MAEPGLTDTTGLKSLSYTLAAQQTTFTVHLGGSPLVTSLIGPDSTHRILEVPVHSRWTPGAHWHEDYVESIRVLRGRANVWINGVRREVGVGGEATFNKFAIHDFGRVDLDSGEDLLIEEWVDNEDGEKEIFFHNVISLVGDIDKFGTLWAFLRLFYVFACRDNFVAFLPATFPLWTQHLTTTVVFGAIKAVGAVAGWKSWYTAYTPPAFRAQADKGPAKGRKEL